MAINKKDAQWKALKDFQELVLSSENPLEIAIEKQVSSKEKVTVYWEEEASSSLFDENETYKVSVSIKLVELLVDSGLAVKHTKNVSEEADFMEILAKKIAEKKAQVEQSE